MDTIVVKKIRYQRDDYAIVVADSDNRKNTVYLGVFPNLTVGAEYHVDCELKRDPKWGDQYKVLSARHTSEQPAAPNDIKLYLMSGVIPGCGPATAEKIYEAFGEDSLRIIREDWRHLMTIHGVSEKKAEQIHNGEATVTSSASLLGFPGITQKKAAKIFAYYGESAMEIIQNNPYRLIYDLDGFAFKTVDAIALKGGMSKDDARRVGGAITFVLYELDKEGHCYCGKRKMMDRAMELLELDEATIERVLVDEVSAGRVIIDGRSVYAERVFNTECETAKYTMDLVKHPARFTLEDVTNALDSLSNVNIVEEQRHAVLGALSNNLYAITGGAGVGKTTVINTIARTFKALGGQRIVMCAPTGKAARRMTEATGCKAMTTARLTLIESEHPVNSLIICDEASMLDLKMAHDLVWVASKGNNQILFVGDVNQLPPIGAGTFFKDILESEIVGKTKLLICHRQSGVIAENATKINKGERLSNLVFDDIHTRWLNGTTVDDAIQAYKIAVQKYGVEQVCLLLPFRQARGSVPATSTANWILRKAYNNVQPNPGCRFARGDRVMNMVNDPEQDIANGDVGTVTLSTDKELRVKMDSGVDVYYPHENESQFDLAYALTIHKSQGSEYACVIMLLTSAAYIMLERNLVYTAVTRGKQEVILMGEKKAYGMAISSQKAIKRNTKLVTRMHELL